MTRSLEQGNQTEGGAREEKWQRKGASQDAKACHSANTCAAGKIAGTMTGEFSTVASAAASNKAQE